MKQEAVVDRYFWSSRIAKGDFESDYSERYIGIVRLGRYLARRELLLRVIVGRLRNDRRGFPGEVLNAALSGEKRLTNIKGV